MQRALLQYDRPANRKLLEAALAELDAMHVLPKFLGAAAPQSPSNQRPRRLPGKRLGKSKPRRPRRRS